MKKGIRKTFRNITDINVIINLLLHQPMTRMSVSLQDSGSVAPVTGMLTVYEDQLRFDRAVDSCSQLADTEEDPDDSMSRLRLDRDLINSVDISDSSPRPRLPSRSVFVLSLYLV